MQNVTDRDHKEKNKENWKSKCRLLRKDYPQTPFNFLDEQQINFDARVQSLHKNKFIPTA